MSTYRTDPDWTTARARYVTDAAPGESPTRALLRRLAAVRDMYRIERRQHQDTTARTQTERLVYGPRCITMHQAPAGGDRR